MGMGGYLVLLEVGENELLALDLGVDLDLALGVVAERDVGDVDDGCLGALSHPVGLSLLQHGAPEHLNKFI